jgi:hypothetical protein
MYHVRVYVVCSVDFPYVIYKIIVDRIQQWSFRVVICSIGFIWIIYNNREQIDPPLENQFLNAVYRNTRCLSWESDETQNSLLEIA